MSDLHMVGDNGSPAEPHCNMDPWTAEYTWDTSIVRHVVADPNLEQHLCEGVKRKAILVQFIPLGPVPHKLHANTAVFVWQLVYASEHSAGFVQLK